MEFAFTEEQQMIRDTAESFLQDVSNSEAIRVAMATESGFDAELWQRICQELYFQAITIPEDLGGMGLGFVELVAVMEQMGRFLLCAPYFSTVCQASTALLVAGTEAQQANYLTKVLEYDQQLLGEFRNVTQEQQHQLESLNQLEGKKKAILARQQQQQRVAEQGRRLQARLLKQAKKDKKKLANEVLQLKQNAARLKKLISKLESQDSTEQSLPSVASDFTQGRGKLGWPVAGQVVIGFGKQKDKKLGTFYESNGLEISVATGSPIRSVAAGKIVFADYFKGYGNLFIISHPGGYHTLYAQTDKMQRDLNDTVKAGDVLGYSGLGGRDSIYFEIRAQGSPVNPLGWLRKL